MKIQGIRFGGMVLITAALVLPGSASAQSLLATRGLGLPMEALNARARALGSEGVGLLGGNLLPTDLSSSTGLLIPTVNVTLQPHWGSGTLDGAPVKSQGTRFPLIGLAYPVSDLRAMLTVTFGAFMDQRWEVEEEGVVELDGVTTPVTNTFRADGGISALRVGWAQRLGRSLAVSGSVGLHMGAVSLRYSRTFDSLAVGSPVIIPFSDGGKWRYEGPTATVGASWEIPELLRVGGSLDWAGELRAKPVGQTLGRGDTYDLPTTLRLGASGYLTPRLSLNLGMSYADWAPAPEGGLGPETAAGAVWSLGGGLEWEVSSFGGRTLPIRLGVRRTDLPFLFEGVKPVEKVFSGGLGLNLTQADRFVLAGVDLALERGSRDAGPLQEEFWRMSMTVRVSGW